MAGNVLGKGYTAGVGMSIGTAFGRIAGTQAAQAALKETPVQQLERTDTRSRRVGGGESPQRSRSGP